MNIMIFVFDIVYFSTIIIIIIRINMIDEYNLIERLFDTF